MRHVKVSFFILLLLLGNLSALAQRPGYKPPPAPIFRVPKPTITLPPRLPRRPANDNYKRPANDNIRRTPAGGKPANDNRRVSGTSSGSLTKAAVPAPKSPEVAIAKSTAKMKLNQLRSLRATLAAAKARRAASGGGKPPKPPGGGSANDNEPPSGGGNKNLTKGFNNASATNAQWLGQIHPTVQNKIPKQLGQATPADKIGLKWNDNKGNSVRVMRGDQSSQYPYQRRDYVRISSNGRAIGPDGKPRSGRADKNPEVHIPLEDWLKWKTWDHP